MNYDKKIEKTKVQIAIIILLTITCYFNILYNEYSFDDQYMTDNKYVQMGITGIKKIWTHPYIELNGKNIDYRPLSLTIYSIEHIIFGKNPLVSHAISILFYLLNIMLIYYVSRFTFNLYKTHTLIPFLVTVLYIVHPSHVEVVASIKNRDEIMCFCFMLLAGIFHVKSLKTQNNRLSFIYILLTFIFFILSILSKLSALSFYACMFLYSLYTKQYRNWKVFLILLFGTGLIFIIFFNIFGEYFTSRVFSYYENPITNNSPVLFKLGLGLNSLLFYLKFLAIPFPFRFYYGYNVISYESIINLLPLISLLIHVILIVILIYSILNKKKYSFFLFSYLFMVLQYSNLIVTYPGIVSERAMYEFSYFFITFIIVFFATCENKRKDLYKYIYIVFILFYMFLTLKRNVFWNNTLSLLQNDIKYMDKSAMGNYLVANNLRDKSIEIQSYDTINSRILAEKSILYFKKASKLSPDRAIIDFMLARTYRYSLNNLTEAEKYLLIAQDKDRTIFGLARELGSLYFIKNEFKKAEIYYQIATLEEPNDSLLIFYQALNMYNAGDYNDFLELNKNLLYRFPNTQYPYLNYGTYYFNRNDVINTVLYFEKAVEYGCTNNKIVDYLIKYYEKNENIDKIIYYKSINTN